MFDEKRANVCSFEEGVKVCVCVFEEGVKVCLCV